MVKRTCGAAGSFDSTSTYFVTAPRSLYCAGSYCTRNCASSPGAIVLSLSSAAVQPHDEVARSITNSLAPVFLIVSTFSTLSFGPISPKSQLKSVSTRSGSARRGLSPMGTSSPAGLRRLGSRSSVKGGTWPGRDLLDLEGLSLLLRQSSSLRLRGGRSDTPQHETDEEDGHDADNGDEAVEQPLIHPDHHLTTTSGCGFACFTHPCLLLD